MTYQCVDDRGAMFEVVRETEHRKYENTAGVNLDIPVRTSFKTTCGQACLVNLESRTFSLLTETGELVKLTPIDLRPFGEFP